MKRRNFLAGILPALFTAKALTEIIEEDKPKYVVVHDPCNPKEGEVWKEVVRWRSSDPVSVGCAEDIFGKCTSITDEGCTPVTDVNNPSYDPKTGLITYIDPEGFTIQMQYHPLLDGPLPEKYQK